MKRKAKNKLRLSSREGGSERGEGRGTEKIEEEGKKHKALDCMSVIDQFFFISFSFLLFFTS